MSVLSSAIVCTRVKIVGVVYQPVILRILAASDVWRTGAGLSTADGGWGGVCPASWDEEERALGREQDGW